MQHLYLQGVLQKVMCGITKQVFTKQICKQEPCATLQFILMNSLNADLSHRLLQIIISEYTGTIPVTEFFKRSEYVILTL